jgi:hypothetical protein
MRDAPFDEDDRGNHRHHHHQQEEDAEQADLSGLHLVERLENAAREPDDDAAKISSDMPLPTPRSVICSPSHMMKIVPVVSVSTHSRRKPHPGL